MRFGSLFTGIGGLDLGLERSGMECAWQVENDPYCIRVLEKHWPEVKRYGDIKEITWEEVEPVDLVCGGFPCQPVSVAGKQLRQEDERWLWPEFERCLRILRPRIALMENVPGLLAGGMGDVLGDLSGLGYDAEWDSLPAAALGAPHLRYRVFIVAYRNRRGREGEWGGGVLNCEREAFRDDADGCSGAVADTYDSGLERRLGHGWWTVEPNVGRVAHGVPKRVDRLRTLGNAVVPQLAQWIGERIQDAIQTRQENAPR